jgi:hypothetical protein
LGGGGFIVSDTAIGCGFEVSFGADRSFPVLNSLFVIGFGGVAEFFDVSDFLSLIEPNLNVLAVGFEAPFSCNGT